MIDPCIDCNQIKRLEFQLGFTDLAVQRVQQEQVNKDIENEIMIQNLTTRMDTMTQDIASFKKEVKEDISAVKQDIASIKKDIPDMFDNAVNKLLAKMFKYVLIGVLVLAGVITLALSRPVILKGINAVYTWVESVEVPNGN
mgnify:CR=1 FL=1